MENKTNNNTVSNHSVIGNSTIELNTSTQGNFYSDPILIDTIVNEDTIELVYKSYSMITYTTWPGQTPDPKIHKDVYGALDGKLQKINTIIGEYVPATNESYNFND